MLLTYKYAIYKNVDTTELHNLANISGIIYNHCIALHKRYYRYYKKHLNKYRLQKHLTKLKLLNKYSFWDNLGSQAIQEITERIDKGYKAFFEYKKGRTTRKRGIPTYKKVKSYTGFSLKGSVGYKLVGNKIFINKIGYKFKLSRDYKDFEIKKMTVKRDKCGNFFITLSLIVNNIKRKHGATGNAGAIDFGLKKFLTFDNGDRTDSPLWFKKNINKIKKLNKTFSRKKENSNNYKRAKLALAKGHIEIANQRGDWQWKLANELFSKYDTLYIEDLNIAAMKKLWGRKVSDLAFSSFISKLEHIASKEDKRVVKIDRFFPSSKLCSCCGNIKKDLNLKDRVYTCDICDLNIDRDINAAINIKVQGLLL